MTIISRYAILSDLDKINDLELKLFPIDHYSKITFKNHILSDKIDLFLIEDFDTKDIIAYGEVIYHKGSSVAHITAVAVDKPFEGQGFGRKIVLLCEYCAVKRGYKKIRLEVRANNLRAIELYERMGFVFKKEKVGYYKDGMNAKKYVLTL